MEKQMKGTKLMEDLKSQILSGKLGPGAKLPSENVLSKEYGISRQTVRKALEILHQEGFVYAEHGRGTFCLDRIGQQGASGNVAVVMTYLSDYIFPYVIKGIDEILEPQGYSILLKSTHNSRQIEAKCLEELVRKNIDGLIIEPSKSQIACRNQQLFEMLEQYHVPYVFIQGIYHGMEQKPHVLLDDCKGGYLITKHLLDCGHRRIVGIFKADDMQGQERHKGYVQALQEAGILYDPVRVIWFHTEDRQTLPYEMMRQMAQDKTFDAVVSYNDRVAMEVIQALNEENIRVPEDISVTGFDDSVFGQNFKVPLTTIRHPQDKLGEEAAKLLLKLMSGTGCDSLDTHILMEPELILRDSTRNRNGHE